MAGEAGWSPPKGGVGAEIPRVETHHRETVFGYFQGFHTLSGIPRGPLRGPMGMGGGRVAQS